jgi:hypothetical protein
MSPVRLWGEPRISPVPSLKIQLSEIKSVGEDD